MKQNNLKKIRKITVGLKVVGGQKGQWNLETRSLMMSSKEYQKQKCSHKLICMLDSGSQKRMRITSKKLHVSLLALFEIVTMPFGLKNAPSLFQKAMEEMIKDVLGVCCEVYLDDIIIYSENEQQRADHVQTVLT